MVWSYFNQQVKGLSLKKVLSAPSGLIKPSNIMCMVQNGQNIKRKWFILRNDLTKSETTEYQGPGLTLKKTVNTAMSVKLLKI